jgi:hypothetical protein
VTLSRGGRVAGLVALALLASGQGCGGGGGGGGEPPPPGLECGPGVPCPPQTFEFTVSVPGATAALGSPAFFQDEGLTRSGVEIRSATRVVTTTGASVSGPQRVVPAAAGLARLVVHFDASGSIDDANRDPFGDRFTAARGLIAGVGAAKPGTPARVYTFRSAYAGSFKLMSPADFAANDGGASDNAVNAASAEGASTNSPALTATHNIIDALPASGGPTAMLLLTDGENNAEDPAIVPGCQGTEGSPGTGCGNVSVTVAKADQRNVRVFVAGLGNNDQAQSRFRPLAEQTDAAFVKATRSGALNEQFQAIGRLILSGGVVVNAETNTVNLPEGSSPFVRGWMRFDRPAAGCPGGSVQHNSSTCKIQF